MTGSMATSGNGGTPADDLPPRFDPATYLSANPDLTIPLEEAASHYESCGRAEGRVASPLALRENLIALIADGRSVLEIGPFCNPLMRGPAIAYLDVLDADQLRARAIEIGIDPAGCPPWIDYVGGLDQVRRRFDAVISSHAIEHQPDLVEHFRQIERILEADGMFCLIIPDKRYCFDHYIAESTIAGVIQAHREQRRLHSLASVIEHVALTTHNDSHRHWAGDHGVAVPPDRPARVEKAIRDHDFNPGRYVDVHAWYFTPDSFRTIVETLSALGLTGLELAGVYDPAHGRNEFCAVLRLGAEARARRLVGHDEQGGILLLQTSDADRYAPMLAVTATNVREYCRRHGYGYESFVGIKRGVHPWQATFNRIPMFVELVERGFTGWAVYLDADAYIQDLDFDLAAYLADKGDRAAIFATSGVTGEHWDVNAGVALINLGHPLGRALVERWAKGFDAHDDARLRAASEWMDEGNDQDLLHGILRESGPIADAVLIEPMSFLNGPDSSFIRQHLRASAATLQERMDGLATAVAATLRPGGSGPASLPPADRRWVARFAHDEAPALKLVAAAAPSPDIDLADRICTARRAVAEAEDPVPPYQAAFARSLLAGDAVAVAQELASLGSSSVARGVLGGDRQHERARDRQFAERVARWTYDKMVSLAEAIGCLPLENPENGDWGTNAQIEPERLFHDLEVALDADLGPPPSIGGHLGLSVGRGIVLHMRMIDAIHAAWRVRQLAESAGLGSGAGIAEIGGGAGLTAYYARRLGLTSYRTFDVPTMNAVQAYVLAGRGQEMALAGEGDGAFAILPRDAFGAIEPGSIDILLNSDGLPQMERGTALAWLADARRLGVRHILSINQEARVPGQTPVSELIESNGGYRRISRHRHWLRSGYVEEHYIRNG